MASIGFIFLIMALILFGITIMLSLIPQKYILEKLFIITFIISAILLNIAFFYLIAQFLINNAQYQLVWNYSSETLPWWLKMPALWSNPEGATFTWSWIVANLFLLDFFIIRKSQSSEKLHLKKYFGFGAAILAIFLIPSIVINPFRATNALDLLIYPDGFGLHNELANPLFVVHPPLVLIGYSTIIVGFIKIFSTQDMTLINFTQTYFVKGWIIASLITITAGIGIGGYWAYNTTGWGGYWSWDPVETSALIIWIFDILILHISKNTTKSILPLYFITYLSVISAAFTNRSGLWFAVHTWSTAQTIGPMIILALLGVCIYLIKIKKQNTEAKLEMEKSSQDSKSNSGDTIQLGILLIAAIMFFTLVQSMGNTQPAFYESRIYPLVVLILFLMIKNDLSKKMSNYKPLFFSLIIIFFVIITLSVAFPWNSLIWRTSKQASFLFSGLTKANFGTGFLFVLITLIALKIHSYYKFKNLNDILHLSMIFFMGILILSSSFRINRNYTLYPSIDQKIERDWFSLSIDNIEYIDEPQIPSYLDASHQYTITFTLSSGSDSYTEEINYIYYRNQNSSEVITIYQTWQVIYLSIAELVETPDHKIDSMKLYIGFHPLISQIWGFGLLTFICMMILPMISKKKIRIEINTKLNENKE